MEPDRLAELGLAVQEGPAGPEIVLALQQPPLNPLTRQELPAVTLAVAEELLIPVDPPELAGLPPLALDGATTPAVLESRVLAAFEEHLQSLGETRAALEALGLTPSVEPGSLELRAEIHLGGLRLVLGGDKQGKLRVVEVHREGALLRTDVGPPFTLAQFPDAAALQAHLAALISDLTGPRSPTAIDYAELSQRFGPGVRVPPGSALELVSDFAVRGERYRFVAARVRGRTFRGLLAGPDGKKWADHFQLEDFPGVADVACRALGIAPEEIAWLGEESGP